MLIAAAAGQSDAQVVIEPDALRLFDQAQGRQGFTKRQMIARRAHAGQTEKRTRRLTMQVTLGPRRGDRLTQRLHGSGDAHRVIIGAASLAQTQHLTFGIDDQCARMGASAVDANKPLHPA